MENQILPPTHQPSPTPPGPITGNHQELQKYAELLEHASALLVQVRDGLRRLSELSHTVPIQAMHSMGAPSIALGASSSTILPTNDPSMDERVVEGVFNGYSMIGDDEKTYQIPPNYASKSKLVEGDRLKLVIQPNGQFVYKQIGPVERERRVGKLERTAVENGYAVTTPERTYRVLMASITYFHGQVGDEVVLLVPRGGNCIWAAVENIMRTPSMHAVADPVYETHHHPFVSTTASTPMSVPPPSPAPSVDPLEDDLAELMSDFRPRSE